MATGALTQAGSLGTLVGPPLYARLAETGNWVAVTVATAVAVTAGVAFALAAMNDRGRAG